MTVATEAEQVVERQAAGILERAAQGVETGTFEVQRLGPSLAPSIVNFAGSSSGAARAYTRFARASLNFERRRDLGSIAILQRRVQQMIDLVDKAGLRADEAETLQRELRNHLSTIQALDASGKELAAKLAAVGRRAPLRRVGAAADVTHELLSAKVRLSFLDMVAAAVWAPGKLPPELDAQFLVGYRKISKVLGADLEQGWKRITDYLLENADEIKAYRRELDRLEAVIAKETDPDTLAHLRDKAYEATRKRGVHSVLKGLLGELYASRWSDWKLIKSGYLDLARQLAKRLGREWEPIAVQGKMYLGPLEIWDEAILLVNRKRIPPEAKLFLAAQFKVALEPAALSQTINDALRETARQDLRIVLPSGGEEWFQLTPLPEGATSHRWVLNAVGGEFPERDIAALLTRGIQVHQQTLPISVDEFNALADRLIKACADLF